MRGASSNRVFTDLAMASTNVVVGKALKMSGRSKASFQMTWTGTPTGVFSFRQSDQADACLSDGTVADSTKFQQLVAPTAFTAQQPAGAATSATTEKGLFGFADMSCEWLLPVYTNTTGSGTGQGFGKASV